MDWIFYNIFNSLRKSHGPRVIKQNGQLSVAPTWPSWMFPNLPNMYEQKSGAIGDLPLTFPVMFRQEDNGCGYLATPADSCSTRGIWYSWNSWFWREQWPLKPSHGWKILLMKLWNTKQLDMLLMLVILCINNFENKGCNLYLRLVGSSGNIIIVFIFIK